MKKITFIFGIIIALIVFNGGQRALAGESSSDCALCHGNVVDSFKVGAVDKNRECLICHQQFSTPPKSYSGGSYHGSDSPVFVDDAYNVYDKYIGNFRAANNFNWNDPTTWRTYASVLDVMANAPSPTYQGITLHQTHLLIMGRSDRNNNSKICERCHGLPNRGNKADCLACHKNQSQVNHSAHGSINDSASYPVIDGNSMRNITNFTCINSNCHQLSFNLSTYTVWLKTQRDDGKQLCVNCHNVSRNGYEIDKSGHGDDSKIEELHVSGFTPNPDSLNCNDCHAGNENILIYHGTLGVKNRNKIIYDFTNNPCSACHSNNLTPKADQKLNDVITLNNKPDPAKTNCDKCHEVNHTNNSQAVALHDSVFPTLISSSEKTCLNCHISSNLAIEHADVTSNQQERCTICHNNPNLSPEEGKTVKEAIANKNANCNSCHSPIHTDLTNQHVSGFFTDKNVNCAQCHSDLNNISSGHLDLGYTCDTCHYDNTKVANEISQRGISDKTNCDQCHNTTVIGREIHPQDALGNHQISFKPDRGLDCVTCHSGMETISTGHINLKNKGYNCNTCHDNETYTFKGKNLNTIVIELQGKQYDCSSCHEIHPNVDLQHNTDFPTIQDLDCNSCHQGMNQLNTGHVNVPQKDGTYMNCATCHDADQLLPKDNSKTVAEIIAENSTFTCTTCHDVHQDLSNAHDSSFVPDPKMNCSSCHQSRINLEHQGKKDKFGQDITCATCHKSDNPLVTSAIEKRITECNACHTIHPDVSTIHSSTYVLNQQLNCADCHSNILSAEHSRYQDAQGNPYGCATCHNSTNARVTTAISSSKVNCDACHQLPHNDVAQVNAVHELKASFIDKQTYNCGGCHKQSLSAEHTSWEKADGSAYNCATCHAKPEAKKVIASKATVKCDSCHQKTIHANVNEAHWKQYDFNNNSQCQGCHKIHPQN